MAAEKISIVYFVADTGVNAGDNSAYHAQLQYFNSAGQRKIIEVQPSDHPANEGIQTLLWQFTLATSRTPWGPMDVKRKEDNVQPGEVTGPQKTLIEGADLSAVWQKLDDGATKVTTEGYWYNPLVQNSNSFIGTLVTFAGLKLSLGVDPGTADGTFTVPGLLNGLSFPINANIPGAGFGGRRSENVDDDGIVRYASATGLDGSVIENKPAENGDQPEYDKQDTDGTHETARPDGAGGYSLEQEINGVLQLQQQVQADGDSLIKFYDTLNTHPYSEFEVAENSTTGRPTAQMKVDGQPGTADFSGIGQVLGSTLGRALAPNNQFVQIAAGTVLGVAGQKLAQVFLSSLSTNATTVNLTTAFSSFGPSVAGAGAGALASFLIAELGHELHLSGFQEQMFNTTIGGLANGVASKIAFDIFNSGLSFADAIGGINWSGAVTNAIGNLGPNIASLLGSYLAHELVPAQTHAGAVGGQLLGAIGSVVGIALGNLVGGVLNFIIPGIGSLIGTILGTLLGDAFGSTPHPAAIDLVDQAGYLYGFTHYQVSASDGGDYSIPDPMAAATVSVINGYLTAVKGVALDHSKQITVGYMTDPSSLYINGVPGHVNSSFVDADDAVHAAALDALQHTEVIGGDLLMKRAHQNSSANIPEAAPGGGGLPGQAQTSGAEQLVTLGGDLNVAQDYENYLNNREAINALIAANPDTAFSAGWIATFVRVNELRLNQYGASDFLGGLVGFLDSVTKAGLSFGAANVAVSQRGSRVTVEIRVGGDINIPGTLAAFADQTNVIDDGIGKTVQFVFNDGLAAGGFHTLGSGQTQGDTGNDLWFGGASTFDAVTGSGNDILVGGASDDVIKAGAGWDFVDGGAGTDLLLGQEGSDILHGGTGTDILQGGIGNDTYAFGRGDGADTVYDDYRFLHTYTLGEIIAQTILYGHPLDPYEEQGDGGSDTLELGTGIGAADVQVQVSGSDLIVGVRDPANPNVPFAQLADRITLQSWTNPLNRIETLRFADGTTMSLAAIVAAGNGGDDFIVGVPGANAIDGGLGNDTVSYASSTAAVAIALGGSVGAGGDAQGDTIINVENLIGSNFNDTLVGDSRTNTLLGGAGSDILNGAAGVDVMVGGAGDDTYVVDNVGDVVVENAGEGADTVSSSISFTLGANVEGLTLTGSAIRGAGNELANVINGNDRDNVLSGGDGGDTLYGYAGADWLDGGTGADWLDGGAGNDTYVVDNAGDVVVENPGGGTDTIRTSASTTLSANIENLTLSGTAAINGTGNAANNVITGNGGNNILAGADGVDSLFGRDGNDILDGGTGADVMVGGLGDDAYVVDNAGDVVTENAGEGTDTVWSQSNYTLGNSNVENLVLTGSATSGTGNAANNVIYGNDLDNVLDGATGADTMLGGLGNDVYVVDNAGDVVVENAGEGADTVSSSVSYTLGANVESLALNGSASINGTGNAIANVITGNSGNNVLSGAGGDDSLYGYDGNDTLDGGTGADAMFGGTGDDTYIVDDAGDYEADNAGEGFDTVRASVSYTLGQNTEALTLTGSDAIDGFGSADNNVMTGNSGDNSLFGAEGADTLYGGAGNDMLDGGPGADTMFGGLGDDRYVVDDDDLVTENAGEGTDTVYSSISYSLVPNVENLILTDVDAIDGFGNDENNVMTGNAGDNSLFGAEGADTLIGGAGNDTLDGGPGADTMLGGVGDDKYGVDSADDVVTENADEGVDVVFASISYTLGANVENLKLTDVDVISGTGNALDNVITGSDGNNILTGLGGSDTLVGGIGTDTAVYSGHRADYAVSWNAETHNLTITDQRSNSPDGSDTANSIEILQFSDGSAEYDDQGRLTRSTLIGGDGSRAVTNYDADGTQPWSVQLLNYDSTGNLHTFSQNEDDGTLTVTQYDVDENRNWTSYTSTFNNDGRLTALNVAYDDTTSLVTNYDITDISSWSAETGAGGPGTESIHIVDTGDAFEWTDYTNVVSSGGSLLTQAGTLDNEGHWLNAYDTTNAFTWTSFFNSYNTDGELTWQSGNQDNGTHWLTVFDTSGTHSWSQATVAFDADYNQMAIGGINDDGSHLIATDEFNPALDLVGWSPFAYIPTQHLWPQAQIWGAAVAENAAAGTLVGTVAGALDDGGTVLNFAMTNNAGGKFVIDAGTGEVTVANGAHFDYETTSFHTIQVRTTDASGEVSDKTFTVTVTNVNEAPINAALIGGTVDENADNGTVVGTVLGIDQDAGSTFSYSLTNNASGRFAINAATGVVTVANGTQLDYEAATSHQITVRTTDQGGLTFDKNFTIAVNNLNEAPTNATLSANTVVENAANGTVVGTVTGVDQDAGSILTYSLASDEGPFMINATTGVVTVQNHFQLDYEGTPVEAITVNVTDQGGLTFTKNFFINLTDVNEAPLGANMISGGTVAENSAIGTAVGTIAGFDLDAGSVLSYSLLNNAGKPFAINATTGAITVAAGTLDYETTHSQSITVRTTDQGGLFHDDNFNITLTDANDAPTNATLTGSTVAENSYNGTVIGTVAGVDPDAVSTFSYSLINNANGRFAINASTGVLTVANGALLDYETATSHQITVRTTDQGGLVFDKSFTIGLTNVNDAPTGGTLSSNTVAENAANGTVVGTVTGIDPDAGTTFHYSLDSDEGAFAINATTGVVTVQNHFMLDYESSTTQSIGVNVFDQAGLFFTKPFTINVTNVNEAPYLANYTGSTTVSEGAANGTTLGTVQGFDFDAGSTLTYSINGTGSPFGVNATTGVVTIADRTKLDYETATSQNLSVRVADQGGLSLIKNVTIAVTNANEAPINITLSNNTLMAHSGSTNVGTLTGIDPDAGAVLHYSMVNDAGGLFRINPDIHNALQTTGGWWNLNAGSYAVTVRVTDQAGLYYDKQLTVNATPDDITVVHGDGSKTETIYDAPKLFYWNSFRTETNAQGAVTSEVGTNDGGGTWQNSYNGAGYSTQMTVTSANGQMVSRTTNNNDGTHTLVANDNFNYFSFQTFTMQFDADWNYLSVSGTNDNGTHNLDPNDVWMSFDTLLWYSSPYVVNLPAPPPGNGEGDGLPVVLDLDGNGIDITPLNRSSASFAMDGGPGRVHTAWVGSNDGLLAIDLGPNGSSGPDGVISQTKEIVFSAWAPGSTSDMAALRQVFDTNHDGRLDLGDDRWSDFRIWQDANSDGISQAGEVRSLADRSVTSIDLTPSGSMQFMADGSKIQGLSTYTRSDGSTGLAGDVGLAFDPGVRQVGSLAQLIQAMATHSADSGAFSPPASQASHDSFGPPVLAATLHP
jgi:Ca2+-binding RTX toxin-like protein